MDGDCYSSRFREETRMGRLLIGAVLAVGLLDGTAHAAATYTALGTGIARTCHQWNENVTGTTVRNLEGVALVNWATGFVSGAGFLGSTDPGAGMTPASLAEWIGGYCSAHPGDNLATAAAAFVNSTLSRQ
jgi:hypothetical protein